MSDTLTSNPAPKPPIPGWPPQQPDTEKGWHRKVANTVNRQHEQIASLERRVHEDHENEELLLLAQEQHTRQLKALELNVRALTDRVNVLEGIPAPVPNDDEDQSPIAFLISDGTYSAPSRLVTLNAAAPLSEQMSALGIDESYSGLLCADREGTEAEDAEFLGLVQKTFPNAMAGLYTDRSNPLIGEAVHFLTANVDDGTTDKRVQECLENARVPVYPFVSTRYHNTNGGGRIPDDLLYAHVRNLASMQSQRGKRCAGVVMWLADRYFEAWMRPESGNPDAPMIRALMEAEAPAGVDIGLWLTTLKDHQIGIFQAAIAGTAYPDLVSKLKPTAPSPGNPGDTGAPIDPPKPAPAQPRPTRIHAKSVKLTGMGKRIEVLDYTISGGNDDGVGILLEAHQYEEVEIGYVDVATFNYCLYMDNRSCGFLHLHHFRFHATGGHPTLNNVYCGRLGAENALIEHGEMRNDRNGDPLLRMYGCDDSTIDDVRFEGAAVYFGGGTADERGRPDPAKCAVKNCVMNVSRIEIFPGSEIEFENVEFDGTGHITCHRARDGFPAGKATFRSCSNRPEIRD